MIFKYLGIELYGYGDIDTEVGQQKTKALKLAGCSNGSAWKNKYISMEVKSRIYKTAIRPIMTYQDRQDGRDPIGHNKNKKAPRIKRDEGLTRYYWKSAVGQRTERQYKANVQDGER